MCGEHFGLLEQSEGFLGSSPHVRGAHRAAIFHLPSSGIIPACAGSTRPCHTGVPSSGDHPRMCGEHLDEHLAVRVAEGSSPHVRGARDAGCAQEQPIGIIPACAGSTSCPC